MAAKVTQALERFSIGDISKAELARYASGIGLRSRYGKVVSEDSLNRMLKNPVYAGYISDNFTSYELLKGKHPALISITTHERNQAILYPKNSRRNEVHLKKNSLYPLKGLVKCINCDLAMYASAPKTGSGGYSPRYHCARSSCKGETKSIKTVTMHQDFEELLHKIKPSSGILRLYKQVLIREASYELGSINNKLGVALNKLNDIDQAKLNAIQQFSEGLLTLEEKMLLADSLAKQKADTTDLIEQLEQTQTIRESDIDLAINIMEEVDKQ